MLLLFLGASTAAPSNPRAAYEEARKAVLRREYAQALTIADAALHRFGASNDRWVWELRLLRGHALPGVRQREAGLSALKPELPPALRNTETAMRRLLYLSLLDGDAQRIKEALAFADRHPRVQPEAYAIAATVLQSEVHARQALQFAEREKDEFHRLWAMNEIAIRCMNDADTRINEAIHWWDAMTPALQPFGDGWLQKIEGNLGWTYQGIGDFDVAIELLDSAIVRARRVGHPDLVLWLVHRGNIELYRHREQDAARYYTEAVAVGKAKGHVYLSHALASLAVAAFESGDLVAARRYNEEALALAKKANDDFQRPHILTARIALAEGRTQEAERRLRQIVGKTGGTMRAEAHSRLADVYEKLNRRADAEAELHAAIATAAEARKDIDEPTLRLPFFRIIEDTFDRYVDMLVAAGQHEKALAVTETARAQTLLEELGHASAPVNARAIARARRATILSYWLGSKQSYLWVVTADKIAMVPLAPQEKIDKLVDQYRRDVTRGTEAKNSAAGRALYEQLVQPGLRGRVIVVPDGRLHALNFETFVVARPAPHYWIEDDVVLETAPSLQLLAPRPARRQVKRSMLLVGNPRSPDAAFPPLKRAGEEVQYVARQFANATVLSDAKATLAAYHAAAPESHEFIHFVTHGVATRQKPLDDAIILGRDSARGEYKLYARKIADGRLHARLVTISSCYGAGTREYVGEGLVGLSWGFLSAGAEKVIGALWEVNDTAAPELMKDLYAGIHAGQDPAVALRNAKLRLVQSKNVRRKPYYWAPFVLYTR